MGTERSISYLNKDFATLKEGLVEMAKNYFPYSYSDFSEASPGMMLIEMAAYVGDILSFYQDSQIQETYLQYAKNPRNLYAMAYMMGYRPKVTTVSEVDLTVTQELDARVPISGEGDYEPVWEDAVSIIENSTVKCSVGEGISFVLKDTVNFRHSSSYDPTEIEVVGLDGEIPSKFLLKKKVKAYSGQVKTATFTVSEYQRYLTIQLQDTNIVGILKVEDSDGNRWYEVNTLGQDTIFSDSKVDGEHGEDVPYVLTLEKVNRRFVTRFTSKGVLELQFGSGMQSADADQTNFLPNPISLSPDVQEFGSNKYDVAYDPSNFLFSNSYGLVPPKGTTLTITYVVGGGIKSNVPAHSISVLDKVEIRRGPGGSQNSAIGITFDNEKAATGGRDGDTIEEIRQNALRSFAEQKRVVTLQDFNVRALSMPSKYGGVSKVYAANESLSGVSKQVLVSNPLAITLYVLSQDYNGRLTYASSIVKKNLRTYLSEYIMVTDAVDIKDAYIVNIGINYDIVVKPNYNSRDVLVECTKKVQDFFRIDRISINEPINLSNLYTELDGIQGVQTVKAIKVVNKVGEGYSNFEYDIDSATRNKIVYPSYDPCIFELRYPDLDIEGRVTSL